MTKFDPWPSGYVPSIDEPSPFGPDIRRTEAGARLENPWVEWRREQLTGIDTFTDQTVSERHVLMERLENERMTLAEVSSIDEPPLTVPNGRHPSLAWVLWFATLSGESYERCHKACSEKVMKQLTARGGIPITIPVEECDPFFGNKDLEKQWLDLAAREETLFADLFKQGVWGLLVPWKDVELRIMFDFHAPHIHLVQGESRYLVTYIPKPDTNTAVEVGLHEPSYFNNTDAAEMFHIVVEKLNQYYIPPKKEAPVSYVPYISAEDAAEGKKEFTLGVHPSVVNAVLGEHYCKVDLTPNQVSEMLLELEKGAMGGRREFIAKMDLVCQLIGYGIHYRFVGDEVQFMVYKRNKRNGEGQLVSVFSLGTGGHGEGKTDFVEYHISGTETISKVHGEGTNIMALEATTLASYEREDFEELRLELNGYQILPTTEQTRAVGFVRDSSPKQGYVGNHHFGVVYATPVPPEAVASMKETNNDFVGWFTPQVLMEVLHLQPHAKANDGKVVLYDGAQRLGEMKSVGGTRDVSGIDLQLLDHDFEPWSRYIIPQLIVLAEILKPKKTLAESAQ